MLFFLFACVPASECSWSDRVDGWPDQDGDGFGSGEPAEVCPGSDGYATEDGDCDDSDSDVYPGTADCPSDTGDASDTGEGSDTGTWGEAVLSSDAAVHLYGSKSGAGVGRAIARGDLTCTGGSDLAIGAPESTLSGEGGSVYVLPMPDGSSAAAGVVDAARAVVNGGDSGEFGHSLAIIDRNRDGCDDLIVGAPQLDTYGGVLVFYGPISAGADLELSEADETLVGVVAEGTPNFGFAIHGVSDHDESGTALLLREEGSAWLDSWSGDDVRFDGVDDEGSSSGAHSLAVGDLTGDGLDDLVIGASWAAGRDGRVSVITSPGTTRSSPPLDEVADVYWAGSGEQLGNGIAAPGDLNGDGYDDLAIGATHGNEAVYLIYGSASFHGPVNEQQDLADAQAKILGEDSWSGGDPGDNFGTDLAEGLDADGDGALDLLIGAPYHSSYSGRSYLFYQGQDLTGTILAADADVVISGASSSLDLGGSVLNLGDVDADGASDFALTAMAESAVAGGVYLFFSGSL